ncbi:MAG: HNH endonuclease [Chloroflexota bacterium]|nr:HNH endonuclease [Chloroflexota bacterium]
MSGLSKARVDRLRKRLALKASSRERRERIPSEVRALVWERDDGRCVHCGADADLQFDHIIPVAKGGGNAADNIQVLCGDCNRRKSDSIS